MTRFFSWLAIASFSAACARHSGRSANIVLAQQPVKSQACSAPEYRQFDFWLGDWDAFESNASAPVARVRVESLLDGCVLREDYQDAGGMKGQSFNIYDASRRVWHQSWVTNRGKLLVIEGKMQADEMVLLGAEHAGDKETLVRGTWKRASGGVREIGVTSTDGGKTWTPWFDLVFRPHKRPHKE